MMFQILYGHNASKCRLEATKRAGNQKYRFEKPNLKTCSFSFTLQRELFITTSFHRAKWSLHHIILVFWQRCSSDSSCYARISWKRELAFVSWQYAVSSICARNHFWSKIAFYWSITSCTRVIWLFVTLVSWKRHLPMRSCPIKEFHQYKTCVLISKPCWPKI